MAKLSVTYFTEYKYTYTIKGHIVNMSLLGFWQLTRLPPTIGFLVCKNVRRKKIKLGIAFNSIYGSFINGSKQLCLVKTLLSYS